MKLTNLKLTNGTVVDLMRGCSQYLALALAEEYSIKVGLWTDIDTKTNKEIFVHSFVVFGDCLYYDAKGFFTSIDERLNLFKHNQVNVQYYTAKQAREKLKNLKVQSTNIEIKKAVREQVRDYWVQIDMKCNDGIVRNWVYFSEGAMIGVEWVFFLGVGKDGIVGQYISKVSKDEFILAPKNVKLVERKNYKGLSYGELSRRI